MAKNSLTSRYYSSVILIFIHFFCFAQENYYYFPIRPGQQNFLSGTMGELRGSHFHAGIDIKTGGVENYNVHCSADGYVSRISISPYGYGKAIYIQHPNETTTVYAHCNNFTPEIDKYILDQQYIKKSFPIELYLDQNKFVVKKGEIIGKSGNTGGSMGPHLHYEIRNSEQEALDPLKKGAFKEIKDNISPLIEGFTLAPASINSRVNNEFQKFFFQTKSTSTNSYIADDICAIGEIELTIDAVDRLNGATNKNGITKILVELDNQTIFEYSNDVISFVEKKQYQNHIDYETWYHGYDRMHKCFKPENSTFNYYSTPVKNGKINIKDTLTHHVVVKVWDSYDNISTLKFRIQNSKSIKAKGIKIGSKQNYIHNNVLRIEEKSINHQNKITLHKQFINISQSVTYSTFDHNYYLINLSKNLPDSVSFSNGTKISIDQKYIIPPNKKTTLNTGDVSFTFSQGALFDTLFFIYKKVKNKYQIGEPTIPLNDYVYVSLKTHEKHTTKHHVYSFDEDNKLIFEGGKWSGNTINFKTRSLGTYTILEDSIAPSIQYLGLNKNECQFKIDDKLSGIKSYNAYLDGKWLLLIYDYKNHIVRSERQNKTVPLSGNLEIIVIDEAGNSSSKKIQL